ncbi:MULTISPECIES: DUF6950 family protein [unclassified Rhizobium]
MKDWVTAMLLEDFLEAHHRFRYGGIGGNDCMTFAAAWVREATGVDVIPHLRGSYSDANQADLVIQRNGGMVAIADNALLMHGFQRTRQPQDGDVGIVKIPADLAFGGDNAKEISAVRWGPLWCALTPKGGVVRKRMEWVAAWEIVR